MIRFEHSIVCVCVRPGGGVTGAVFNPALAFSIQFSCSGNTFVEYSLVYWISPVLGEQSVSRAPLNLSSRTLVGHVVALLKVTSSVPCCLPVKVSLIKDDNSTKQVS